MAYRYFYSRPTRRQQSNADSVQAKEETAAAGGGMKMGSPGDAYEVEADRVADQVMASPEEDSVQAKAEVGAGPMLMRAMEEEPQAKPEIMRAEEEEPMAKPEIMRAPEEEPMAKPEIMRAPEEEPMAKPEIMKAEEEEPMAKPFVQKMSEEEPMAKTEGNTNVAANSSVQSRIQSSRGLGKPLPAGTRNFMETRIGANFSQVNIHTDARAVQMSKDLKAQAFTVGRDIYFNQGKYNPESSEGKHLLAHELTHVVQQKGRE